ncbi:hypothetical protein F7725_021502 [Dissostichus mawsoni]|uniref:Ig-like domain-containing protein n=1 Tax=Dissostichus mawsoni TaxID=36200 RepID=A0A7J5ZBZ7_DISMA|nr:hypothetical protein F7725_021502 [Dissostichus mawsoni]
MCPPPQASPAGCAVFLLLVAGLQAAAGAPSGCPPPCVCVGELVDCSRLRRGQIPRTLPEWTVQLDLSHNKLRVLDGTLFSKLQHLREIKLNHNELEEIPDLGPHASNLTTLILDAVCVFRANNRISRVSAEQLRPFLALETLDLSNNNMVEIKAGSFPALALRNLYLNNNRISSLETGCFTNLSSSLQLLRLNRNRLASIPAKIFTLPHLLHLELSRNRVRRVEGLTQLDHNNLTEVSKGWLYGLLTLNQLHLSHNAISRVRPDAWEFCQKLSELNLSSNHLSRLEESSFVGLSLLDQLHIGNNRVSFIADGAFRGLSTLHLLDLQNNEISWTIEDMNGPFSALDKLNKLDLSNNAIMSIQANAFSQMRNLQELRLNTSSLLCDCQLQWLPVWVAEQSFLPRVTASCAHPQTLKGSSVFSVSQDQFPETQSALRGSNVTFICSAASSSDSPMTFSWKKDNEVLDDAEIHNQAHLRVQGGMVGETEVTEYTTTLQLRDVEFSSEGKYQCVISNHFGSSYSTKARLTVNMLPSFTKMPMDLSIRAGATARLECAAVGHPSPQIAWQKDGGTDFPAARERRMHVMPEDDVFFIVDVKAEDIETPSFLRPLMDRTVAKGETAVLQCIAGGSPLPRLNWTKDDSPLVVTERHFFAAANQLLIIVDAAEADAGTYTCEMSNTLGTERGNVRLACSGVGGGMMGGAGADNDGWTTVGIVIIAVVCCVVGTSLVWVVIIYHTRRRSEDCSVTNTDETHLPADIPSYLSSQGTLAERQDGYIPSESGSSDQYMSSSLSGFYLQPKDMNGFCQLDTGSETDMEAAIDPLLCHYQGPISSLLRRDNMYSTEPSDVFTGCSMDQRPVYVDSYSGSLSSSKMKDYFLSEHFDLCSSSVLMQLPNASLHLGPPHQQSDRRTSMEEAEANVYGKPHEGLSPSSTFMGTFGKAPWTPHKDLYPGFGPHSVTHHGITLHENPYAAPDADSDLEESLTKDSASEQSNSIYEQPFDLLRTDPPPQRRPST